MKKHQWVPVHRHTGPLDGGSLLNPSLGTGGSTGGISGGSGTSGSGPVAAVDVTIADAGAFFTAANVEAVLQEIAKKDIGVTPHGVTGTTETFDALTGWHSATLNAATVTFTFTGATSGLLAFMVLQLTQDGTGGRLVSWPGSVVWVTGTAPILATAAGATDILEFASIDGGATWLGFAASGSALIIKDEGSSLTTAASSIDFVGAGVVASGTTGAKTVTINGAQHILLADGHATPFVFTDLLQMDDGSDFMWSDP